MEQENTITVTLEIINGSLGTVKIDGRVACEVDDKTREEIFADGTGPRYVATILYHIDPITKMARVCAHKRCKLVC